MRDLKRFTRQGDTIISDSKRCIAFEPVENVDIETPINAMHGRVEYIFDESHSRPYIFADTLTEAIERRLKAMQFDPDKDRLILSGNIVAVSAMISVVCADYGWCTALAYDTKIKAYHEMLLG